MTRNPVKLDLSFFLALIGIVLCSILIFSFLRIALLTYNSARNIGSRGTIVTGDFLSVDRDFIDWGVLYPSQNKTETLNITNTAPVKMKLLLSTASWDPVNASDYLFLSWNYTDLPIAAKETIPLALHLYVSPSISEIFNFTFTIKISAQQTT